jgi:hypothetical protein
MIQIDRMTFTGADDSVSPADLVALSRECPFVEWGILLSANQIGTPRYPSRTWLDTLFTLGPKNGLQLSAHVCGRFVRDMLAGGDLFRQSLGPLLPMFQRIQWNFHADRFGEIHLPVVQDTLLTYQPREFIFQMDGVNDVLLPQLRKFFVPVLPLFDRSGGAGVIPETWPSAIPNVYCGYAGGLGPESLKEQLPKIEVAANGQRIWLDLESRVRSVDNRTFLMDSVRECVAIIEEYRTRP